MPAKSKSQQRFMGMVHAAQKGEKPASPEVAKAAKGMTKKAATDFASTEHEGLPEKVKEDLGATDFGDDMNTDMTVEEQKLREFIRISIGEIMNEEFDKYAEYDEPPVQGGDLEEDIIPKKKQLTPYQKFFTLALNKFGVDSPDQLTPKMKDKLFNYIDDNWKSQEEK